MKYKIVSVDFITDKTFGAPGKDIYGIPVSWDIETQEEIKSDSDYVKVKFLDSKVSVPGEVEWIGAYVGATVKDFLEFQILLSHDSYVGLATDIPIPGDFHE